MEKKTFYITTPIYYPSDKLHIGHSYCTVATDAIARYKRLQGFDVMFLTGTDEHGQKIETKAEEAGMTPQQFVDNIVEGEKGILDLWKLMNISNDRFIRTTDDYHCAAVQKIFKKMYDNGDIYKGAYKGKYCTPCESFWTESQLKDGCCPDCGRPVERGTFIRLHETVVETEIPVSVECEPVVQHINLESHAGLGHRLLLYPLSPEFRKVRLPPCAGLPHHGLHIKKRLKHLHHFRRIHPQRHLRRLAVWGLPVEANGGIQHCVEHAPVKRSMLRGKCGGRDRKRDQRHQSYACLAGNHRKVHPSSCGSLAHHLAYKVHLVPDTATRSGNRNPRPLFGNLGNLVVAP